MYIVIGLVLPRSMATQAGALLYIVMGLWLPRLAPAVYSYASMATQINGYTGWRRLYIVMRLWLPRLAPAVYGYASMATQINGYPGWRRLYIVMRLWLPTSLATQAGAMQHPGGAVSG